jgi:N-carbamoylputrescine amidase
MALMGAELLFYPTAIGAEPQDATLDTRHMWRRAMVGHAVSNTMPVIAANRVGSEDDHGGDAQRFYGTSFIANEWGDIVADLGASETGVIVASFDLDRAQAHRASMGFFRDRRPQLYGRLVEDI